MDHKTKPQEMSAMFVEFKNDFMPNGFPDYNESEEKKKDYMKMVERYCELLSPFDAKEVREMFVGYIRSGGTFFPRVGDLTKHQKKKEAREGPYIPTYEETLEITKRLEAEEAERKSAEQNMTAEMREQRERERLEIYEKYKAIRDKQRTSKRFGRITYDFSDSESGDS